METGPYRLICSSSAKVLLYILRREWRCRIMYIPVFVLISRYKILLYIGAVDGIIDTFIDISKVNKQIEHR